MKTFLHKFYLKISIVFLVLLFCVGLVQIWLSVNSSMAFVRESDQALNEELARDVANNFQPFLTDSIDLDGIEHLIHELMIMNPRVEFYLMDDEGKVLAFFAEPQKKVKLQYINLEPIHQFLAEGAELPILGDDPRNIGLLKPFSASRLQIGPEIDGYLYIILGGEKYDTASSMIRESYIFKTMSRSILVTLIFTAIVGLLAFSFLTKKFRKMTRTVKHFEAGDYSQRIDVESEDEIGQLANAFNQMADTIVANMDELKRVDKQRRELVANVSHDLRSPLASIQGYLETILMKDESLTAAERKKYLNTIYDSSISLSQLVAELFELSKYDAKQVQPQPEPFSITELTQDVFMKFKPKAESRNINFFMNFPKDLPMVIGDIGMIERALSNLIENALHYTPKKGSVKIELSRHQNKIAIVVQDTGYGIPEDELSRVFERFYRVEKSREKASGGTGLGLAIASKIVELHNDNIAVESEINKGTSFSFSLAANMN